MLRFGVNGGVDRRANVPHKVQRHFECVLVKGHGAGCSSNHGRRDACASSSNCIDELARLHDDRDGAEIPAVPLGHGLVKVNGRYPDLIEGVHWSVICNSSELEIGDHEEGRCEDGGRSGDDEQELGLHDGQPMDE